MPIERRSEPPDSRGERLLAGVSLGVFALLVNLLVVSLLSLREPSWPLAASYFASGLAGPFSEFLVFQRMTLDHFLYTLLTAAVLLAAMSVGIAKPTFLTLPAAALAVCCWVTIGVVSYGMS